MPDATQTILTAVASAWDQHIAMLVSAKALPMITSTGRAVALVIAGVTTIFAAGGGFALWYTTQQGAVAEVRELRTEMREARQDILRLQQETCFLRISLLEEGDPIVCYVPG